MSTEINNTEGIVLKDRNGNDVAYYGIETVTFDTTTEGKQQTYTKGVVAEGVEVPLDLAEGDQVIQAPEGYLVKQATIKKPDTLLPENIKAGETVAGVAGTFAGNFIEGVEVVPDFSGGDQAFTAPDGYGVKSGLIKKPETLTPGNIRAGETVAGVTGTFAGNFLENVPVVLDLSDGDQVMAAPDGYGVKSAIIKKPDTLLPENIADGVEVAGVVGTHKSGGGGVDTTDENMQNFAFNFAEKDDGSPELVLRSVLYDNLYQATGSYDVTVPETLAGFDVTLGKA